MEDLGILQIGVNYIFETQSVSEKLMGQHNKPYFLHKSVRNWKHSSEEVKWS